MARFGFVLCTDESFDRVDFDEDAEVAARPVTENVISIDEFRAAVERTFGPADPKDEPEIVTATEALAEDASPMGEAPAGEIFEERAEAGDAGQSGAFASNLLANIPAELKAIPRWVGWRFEVRNGKRTKVPVNARTGRAAIWSNPDKECVDFDTAIRLSRIRNLEGVGFIFEDDIHLTAIDLDDVRDEDGNLAPHVAEVLSLKESYAEWSPSGNGVHIITGTKIVGQRVNHHAGVEIYGNRRFLTITGRLIDGSPSGIREAPKTIELLTARVDEFDARGAAEKAQAGHGDGPKDGPKADKRHREGDGFFRAVNDAALRNIPAWLLVIFPHAKRSANGAWRIASNQRGRRDLQEDISVDARGTKDFGLEGGRTAIDLVVEFHGAPDAQEAALWLCDRLSIDPASIGWRGGSHAEADDVANKAEVEDIKAKLAEREKREADTGNDRLADDLLRPDGVLGDMVDYILSISRRPIRIFAVASSVSALGNIIGRRVAGPTGSGTHSYNALLADTAGGKAAGLDAVTQIMLEVDHASMGKALRLVGPSRLSSGPGLWRHIKTSPLSLSVFDEIGNILSGVSNPKAPHYLKEISGILREVWGKSFKYVGSKANADGSGVDEDIKWPAYSLLGASTAEEFFGALTSRDATNGLLNRFIVFFSDDKPVYVHRPPGDEHHAPKHIIDALLDLHLNCMGNRDKPNLRDQIKDASFLNDDDKIVIEWDNDDVDKAFEVFSTDMFERTNKKNKEAPLYGRVAENAIRLATIHAVSRAGLRAKVTMRDLEWGQAIVLSSANRLVKEARFRISDNEHQAEANHIKSIIRKAGSAGIMAAELRRAIGGSIRGRSYKDIMESLIEGREIISETERRTDEKGGRPKTTYYINADYDFDE